MDTHFSHVFCLTILWPTNLFDFGVQMCYTYSMKYVLIDTANLFFRARHGAFRASDTWEKVGFALHVTLMAANKMARRFEADHVVFALEGRSWRKDITNPTRPIVLWLVQP
jgi:hypothetical protein